MDILYTFGQSDEEKSAAWLLGDISLLLRRGAHKRGAHSTSPLSSFGWCQVACDDTDILSSHHLTTIRGASQGQSQMAARYQGAWSLEDCI